jgi:hypothetical protein
MREKRGLLTGLSVSTLVLISAISTLGQQKQAAADRDVIIERERIVQGPEGSLPPPEDAFFFIAAEMSFDGELVKGAPYSAQAVTETTQTLSDGNRIVNKSTVLLYRDSEGRTRREQTLKAIGPLATAGEPLQTIFISDPVADVSYVLDPRTHVARKSRAFRMERAPFPSPAPDSGPGFGVREEVFNLKTPAPGGETHFLFKREGARPSDVVTESLGKQIFDGVEAEGTLSKITIPAGQIGNERAIEIVTERWYSSALNTLVKNRHSDPRSGETVYRLTNISRSEPPQSLFEVPADYKVKEGLPMPEPMRMRMRKPANNP